MVDPRAHLEWELRQMLTHVKPADLMTSELLAVVELLRPAHARRIEPPTGAKAIMRFIPATDGTTSV